MYKVPLKAANNALRGLTLVSIYRRGGTAVGREMAAILSTAEMVSFDIVKKVSEYFPRHQGDKLEEDGKNGRKLSNGYIAWMLWGGDEGWKWAKGIVEKERE